MKIDYFWIHNHASSEARDIDRRRSEARAAAYYTAFRSVWRVVSAPFRRLDRELTLAAQARETRKDLYRLNDHMLRDIGITRADVECIADAASARDDRAGITHADLPAIREAAETRSRQGSAKPEGAAIVSGRRTGDLTLIEGSGRGGSSCTPAQRGTAGDRCRAALSGVPARAAASA
ncbi:MAG: DUF1127 domain-containing protein [Paracoccaceae bacterium]